MILPPRSNGTPSRGAELVQDLTNLDIRQMQSYVAGEYWGLVFPGRNGKEFSFELISKEVEVDNVTTVTIAHKFAYLPTATAIDLAGNKIDIDYNVSETEIEVTFASPFTGKVLLR